MAKKKRQHSKLTVCPICNKEVFVRGLKPHVRLKHQLNIVKEISKPNIKISFEPTVSEVRFLSDDKELEDLNIETWKHMHPDSIRHYKVFCRSHGSFNGGFTFISREEAIIKAKFCKENHGCNK